MTETFQQVSFLNYEVYHRSAVRGLVNDWQAILMSNLITTKDRGSLVIEYNFSSDITVASLNLQSGILPTSSNTGYRATAANMKSILNFMEPEFCDHELCLEYSSRFLKKVDF